MEDNARVASSTDFLAAPLGELLDEIASETPTPGGGSVAALVVAMAAGLLEMAARASAESWSEAGGAAAQAEAVRLRAGALARRNAEVYEHALAALALATAAVGKPGDAVIERALREAAEVPLEIAEAASDLAGLGALVSERVDPRFRADAATAVLLCEAAARAAAEIVAVNLTTVPQDPRAARANALAEDASSAKRRALRAGA